jgi:hypothetical protein
MTRSTALEPRCAEIFEPMLRALHAMEQLWPHSQPNPDTPNPHTDSPYTPVLKFDHPWTPFWSYDAPKTRADCPLEGASQDCPPDAGLPTTTAPDVRRDKSQPNLRISAPQRLGGSWRSHVVTNFAAKPLPLLFDSKELRRMKQQATLEEFERFEAAYGKAAWEEVLKPRRETEGPNWRPSWMEGMCLQSQVHKILWAQFRASRRGAIILSRGQTNFDKVTQVELTVCSNQGTDTSSTSLRVLLDNKLIT